MIRIYIDIDGVLLTKRKVEVPENAYSFLRFLINNFDCYWLTTHCKGDSSTALKYLCQFYDEEFIKELVNIKATNWDALKTEGIDLKSNFYWLDDYAFNAEKIELDKNNLAERLIVVDLEKQGEFERIKSLLLSKPIAK